jgi:hypothetical protein
MSDKPKYVIEKNVPLPEPRAGKKLYEYHDIPFDQMEVGDCVSITFKNLIPNNSHPDAKERQAAVNSMMAYAKRKFSDWQFKVRQEKPLSDRSYSQASRQKTKEYNLNNRCFRIWRTN